MITIQSRVHVPGISGSQLLEFMLNCTDDKYHAWWPGTHLALHTVEGRPGKVGSVIYMDEYVGRRRLRMKAVITEILPGKKVVWQFKQGIRLPARLILETAGEGGGILLTHTLEAGFRGLGRLLDPLLRLYLTPEFERAMDEHAQTEFPMLGATLSGAAIYCQTCHSRAQRVPRAQRPK